MNGIEKIIDRISGDAQREVDDVLASAKAQAAEITAKYQAQAKAEADDILARGEKAAAERGERLASVAQLECRKEVLRAKQEVVEEAFQLAMKKLTELPQEKCVALLADLAAQAASKGTEALIFSAADRARLGKAVVVAANQKLGGQGPADPVPGDPPHAGRLHPQRRPGGGQLHLRHPGPSPAGRFVHSGGRRALRLMQPFSH